jgi:hypothetical protein
MISCLGLKKNEPRAVCAACTLFATRDFVNRMPIAYAEYTYSRTIARSY